MHRVTEQVVAGQVTGGQIPRERTGIGAEAGSAHGGPAAFVRALRPVQWVKNVLVFVAPGAAHSLVHLRVFLDALGVFGIFCAASSATYLVNDVLDAMADRLHPEKRHRPIASGAVGPAAAIWLSVVLALASIGASLALAGWPLATLVGVYLGVSLSYSLWLKREPVIELVAVASGFVIRAIAGGVGTHTYLSQWFLVVTSFGALLMVVGKRAAELAALGEQGSSHRPALAHYTPTFLRSAMTLCAGGAVTTYCLWAFDRSGLAGPRAHLVLVELSVVPVVTGVLYALRLLDLGRGGAPTDLMKDRMLWILGLLWALLVGLGVYA